MVQPQRARERLDVLLDALADLRPYRESVPYERLATERDTQHMVLHALYVAAQAAIDLAMHAAADAGAVAAPTYREAFASLAGAGLVEPDLADRLSGWSGLRNVLAHHYTAVDFDLVHRVVRDDLGDLEIFAALASGWLDAGTDV